MLGQMPGHVLPPAIHLDTAGHSCTAAVQQQCLYNPAGHVMPCPVSPCIVPACIRHTMHEGHVD